MRSRTMPGKQETKNKNIMEVGYYWGWATSLSVTSVTDYVTQAQPPKTVTHRLAVGTTLEKYIQNESTKSKTTLQYLHY
jgi:hypothetical protein